MQALEAGADAGRHRGRALVIAPDKDMDEAAQRRVTRAVERLRELFAKRGVAVSAGGLVVVISANAVLAAPVELAVTVSNAVLAATAVPTSIAIAATKTIVMSTLQKAIAGVAIALLSKR